MRRRLPLAGLAALLAGIAAGPGQAVTVPERADDRSGAPVWKWEGEGMAVRAMGRPPAHTRAFFIARGFPDEAARRFSRGCVFGMTLRNRAAGGPIRFDVAQWRVRTQGGRQPLVPTTRWQKRWRRMGVPERARTAFSWATFPGSESLGEGGYLMGMVAMGLAPGDRFDLILKWRQGKDRRRLALEGLRCPRSAHSSQREE